MSAGIAVIGGGMSGMAAAILCDMGIRNGRRNVEKILDAAQGGSSQRASEDA
ncbi:MAG: hypothetical protein IKQ27_03070 [Lachnospiraceae bacterium]|nr:hypothetical protein [Lachnospiraceae bacterium]